MKKLIMIMSAVLMTACTFDENDNIIMADWFKIALIGFVIIVIVAIISANKAEKEKNEKLKKAGIDPNSFNFLGKYVGGHTSLNDEIARCVYRVADRDIIIYKQLSPIDFPQKVALISLNDITDIQVADKSTLEKNITLGRVLLVGVFALAWKKKQKNEIAFVSIEWKQNTFLNTTIFAFEDKNAMQTANTVRNNLIKEVSKKS